MVFKGDIIKPEEIKPDTQLCTIIGYNAQTGKSRKYFNAIMKHSEINATAIALNIKDDNFDFMMKSLASSPVKRMIVEDDFQKNILKYLQSNNFEYVDFIEVIDGDIIGYNLDKEVDNLVENPKFVDVNMRLAIKMLIIANRWYDIKIDMDLIPTILSTSP